jgi:hypothetical protein
MEPPPPVASAAVGIPKGPAAKFMRHGVLEPLAGPLEGEDQLVETTLRVVRAWRERVEELARAGLHEFAGTRKPTVLACARAVACRPAFIDPEPRTRGCLFAAACPHCWARRAVAYWQAIDRAFSLGHEGLRLRRALRAAQEISVENPRYRRASEGLHSSWIDGARRDVARSPGHDLVEWGMTVAVPFRVERPGTGTICDSLPLLLDQVTREWRPAWFQATRGLAGTFTALNLTVEGGRWYAQMRCLVMAPAGFQVAESWGPLLEGGTTSIHPRPGRETVMAAVVRACQYPRALLTCPDPRLIAHLIDARRGRRLRTATGDFAVRRLSRRN